MYPTSHHRDDAGFSLIEMLVVAAMIGILAAIAVPVSTAMINRRSADSAQSVALTAIQAARNRAIAERRNMQLTLQPPNRILVNRVEVPGPGTTTVEDVLLTEDLTFNLITGLPDTPDAFGAAAAVSFTGPTPVMFTSDGSLIDANGDVVNGTIFMARRTEHETARAITLFGMTGFTQQWKWGGNAWTR